MVDQIDLNIMEILQQDCTIPIADIGGKVNLSTTPCWRRIQKLEEAGYIKQRVAILDPKMVKSGSVVFVRITTNDPSQDWNDRFVDVVQTIPEIVEMYRMSGATNYLLRVAVPDIEAYDRFYKELTSRIEITSLKPDFSIEQVKYTPAVPLRYLQESLTSCEKEVA